MADQQQLPAEAVSIIWQHMLDVARLNRYYAKLAQRSAQRNMYVRFGLAFSGVGALAGFLELLPGSLPHALPAVFAVLIPALILVDFLAGFARKAAVLEAISSDMSAIEGDYRALWERLYAGRIPDSEAMVESDLLLHRMTSATSRDLFGEDEGLNQRSQQDAYRAEELRYAS